jgi:hypothetical protein
MKLVSAAILLALIYTSCQHSRNAAMIAKGTWLLDSQSYGWHKEAKSHLYVTDKLELYRFSYKTPRYTLDSCLTLKDTAFFCGSTLIYHLQHADSSKMVLRDTNNILFFYKRNAYGAQAAAIDAEIKQWLQSDSLKQGAVGWWRLKASTYKPIQLLNNHGICNTFVMHLNRNGDANFYKGGNLDSIESGSWHANPDRLSFHVGCLAGMQGLIYNLSSTQLVMTLGREYENKLYFDRITPKL